MLKNGGHLYFNQLGEILLLPIPIHKNESSLTEIQFFAENSNIAGFHIKMDTPMEKVTNLHIKRRKLFILKYVRRVFSKRTLMTQVWSLILPKFALTPTIIYPQKKRVFNLLWSWRSAKFWKLQQCLYWMGTSNFKTHQRKWNDPQLTA